MPTYDYLDTETGRLVERTVAVEQRDAVPPTWQRIVVSAPGLKLGAADPGSPEVAVPRALRQIEQTVPAREMARSMNAGSVETIKRVWKM